MKSTDNFNDYAVDLTNFKSAIRTIGMSCKENVLVLVETTVPPGTCEKIVSPILQLELGIRGLNGNKIKIAHSYERVMPGPNYIDSIENFYRVYSGVNVGSADAAEIFLKSIISIDKYPLTRLGNTNATEIAKVLENSYRAMNIAFIVEWSRFAETSGVNLFEIVEAIRMRPTHSNMMFPGLGVGGYCLTKDPLLASWSRKNLFNDDEGLMQSEVAVKINDQMPSYAYKFFLSKFQRNVEGLNVSFFGVSYRGDVGDTRYSPVFDLYKYFNMGGCNISLHDPYIPYWYEAEVKVETNIDLALEKNVDIVIITTSHSLYLQESFVKKICNLPQLFIFDTLGIFSEAQYKLIQKHHKVAVLGRGDF
jgi:nucleotide sugar dehydrogenase